ncbi:hypothetical protein, partial [uncultured Eubacterium sp.]|uniref:hypothetical protein n=1 Tax=uncultured Eubacterium sp. TaxID=165185 RepID=UPI0032669F87
KVMFEPLGEFYFFIYNKRRSKIRKTTCLIYIIMFLSKSEKKRVVNKKVMFEPLGEFYFFIYNKRCSKIRKTTCLIYIIMFRQKSKNRAGDK